MEEEEQPRTIPEGVGHPNVGVSSSSGHETTKKADEEQAEMFVASDSFCSAMCAMISKPDIEKMGQIQLETLTRFQGMNTRFNEFNHHSFDRYEQLNLQFQNHTRMIMDMKKDLDIIFRRIRNLKTKLTKQYGGAFAVTSANIQKLEEEIEADREGHEEEKPQTLQQESPSSDHYKNTYSDDSNTSRSATAAIQLQGARSSGAENAPPQENDIASEKQTFEKSWKKGKRQIRPVLRPQLSSSDENYSDEEASDITKEQMVDKSSPQGVQESVLRPQLISSDENYSDKETSDITKEQVVDKSSPQGVQESILRLQLSSSDENCSADEAEQDKQSVQDDHKTQEKTEKSNEENSSKVNYRTTLQPEISSSDESLEDDIDDVSDESNTGGCVSTSPSSEEEGQATQMPNNEDSQVQDDGDKES